MQDTYVDYETFTAKQIEKKALKKTALSIGIAIIVYFITAFAVSSALALPVSFLLKAAPTVELYDIIYESYIAVSYLTPLVLSILPILFIVRIPLRVAVPLRRTPIRVSLPSIMAGLGCSTIGVTVASILLIIFQTVGFSYNVPDQPVPQTAVGRVMYLIIISVLPAIFEELLFRGFMLQSLRRFGDTFAVVISALVFALYHGNFAQFPNAFLLGIFIAFITIRTGSLVTGMILHFINNFGITVLDIFVISNLNELSSGLVTLVYLGFYFILGVAGIVVLAVRYPCFFTLKKPDSPLTIGERTKAFFLQPVSLAGMLLMFGYCFTYFVL